MEIINIIIITLAIVAVILFAVNISLVRKQNKILNISARKCVYRTDRGGLIFIHDRCALDISEKIYKIGAEEIYVTADGGKTWASVM